MVAWSKNKQSEKRSAVGDGHPLPHQVMPAGLRVDASTLVTVEIRTGHRASGASGQKMGMGGLMEDGFIIFSGLIDCQWCNQLMG